MKPEKHAFWHLKPINRPCLARVFDWWSNSILVVHLSHLLAATHCGKQAQVAYSGKTQGTFQYVNPQQHLLQVSSLTYPPCSMCNMVVPLEQYPVDMFEECRKMRQIGLNLTSVPTTNLPLYTLTTYNLSLQQKGL